MIFDGTEVPTKPWTDLEEDSLGVEFLKCLYFNPVKEFEVANVRSVTTLFARENGSANSLGEGAYVWLVDASPFTYVVVAEHDYTGWDCQASATCVEIDLPPQDK